ncbi:MAG TPA: LytTR family DNA-binding domain-containing protein [Bacteroidia bacterium]|nr:LytTR family DNA-binding domain-containing protein [Bacteroidia bacterium]
MKRLKALVVDDEPNAVEGFVRLLTLYCPDIEPAGTASSVGEAITQIRKLKPDVVFLDIEMPEENGFNLVDTIRENSCSLVFVTAHSDYAVRAFRTDAVDYLLKPVSPRELKAAAERVTSRRETMKKTLPDEEYRIRVSTTEGISFIPCAEVISIEGSGRYSIIHSADGGTQLVSRNIGDFETELEPFGFFRVHKSWLINCRHVMRLAAADGGTIELSNGKKVLLSRRRRNDFLKKMER